MMRSARYPGSTGGESNAAPFPLLALLALVALMLAPPPVEAQDAAATDTGLEAWSEIAGVLQHPRCLNCHQAEAPLQGDDGRAHLPRVQRGPAGLGMGPMQCFNCHNTMGNNPTAGVPGAPHWMLAPRSSRWQDLASAEMCAQLTDPARNGNRSDEEILEHMAEDELVLWGWEPGADLEPVPVPHDEFVEILETWVAAGTPCPGA